MKVYLGSRDDCKAPHRRPRIGYPGFAGSRRQKSQHGHYYEAAGGTLDDNSGSMAV